MKKIILIITLILISIFGFSQNKNFSIGLGYGINKVEANDFYGGTINFQLNYSFFNQKRANLTLGILLNSYSTKHTTSEIALFPNGTPFIKETTENKDGAAFGFSVSSQIKLFSLDKKLIPFIQPQFAYLRERVDENLQTFGQIIGSDPTPSGINIINAKLLLGLEYNHRFQFGIYYTQLLSNRQIGSIVPDYTFGGTLSYLFNISFKKKEKVIEE